MADAQPVKVQVKQFDPANFPALYRCADTASKSAQSWYLIWFGTNLGLLILGSLAGSISITDVGTKQILQGIAAVSFFASLGVTLLLAVHRWDKVWYAGRAVSESAKSLTWKFIGGANPFPQSLLLPDAVKLFSDFLFELLAQNKSLAAMFRTEDAVGEQVTATMTGLRGSAVGVKRDVYLQQRVNEQQEWYATNAASNRTKRDRWFGLLVFFQLAAGIAAVLLTINPLLPWRATAVFSTLASATIAWGQVKRFQELAQAYGLAAQELSLISARAVHVGTQDELARFVNDAETAISREHTSWIARRETR